MRARKARKMKQLRRKRRIVLLGLLAVCVLTGVLVAAVSGRVRSWKAERAAVQAAAMQESMSASAAEAESLAAAEAKQYRDNLPDMGAIYGIAVNWSGLEPFLCGQFLQHGTGQFLHNSTPGDTERAAGGHERNHPLPGELKRHRMAGLAGEWQ